MRINGKRYDPTTACEIDQYVKHDRFGNPLSRHDAYYESWTLYKKKTGEYFLYCEGGALSMFSHTCEDGSRCSGEWIAPLTDKQAYEWKDLMDDYQYEQLDWHEV